MTIFQILAAGGRYRVKKNLFIMTLGVLLAFASPAYALFTNGGFQEGTFNGWTLEHGSNYGLTISGGVPVAETVSWLPGPWTDPDYYTGLQRTYITSGIDNDFLAQALPVVKYGLYSALVNSPDWNNHASRIYQEDALAAADRDAADGRFHVRFAWAAVLRTLGIRPTDSRVFPRRPDECDQRHGPLLGVSHSRTSLHPWRTDSPN
jgi:hypothetical protein